MSIFFFFFLRILKLKGADCYSGGAMPREAVRSHSLSKHPTWLLFPLPAQVSWIGVFDERLLWLFSSSDVPAFCPSVFHECLFAPDKRSWNFTMASSCFTRTSIYSLGRISSHLLWLLLFFESNAVSAQCRSSLRILQNAWKYWRESVKAEKSLQKQVLEK